MKRLKDDVDGTRLVNLVNSVSIEQKRMMYGVNFDQDEFMDNAMERHDLGGD